MSEELAARLYQRRHEAIRLRRARLRGIGWQPEAQECHRNAEIWCKLCSGFRHVQGWLVADYGYQTQFIAHSVVENEKGELVDITPNDLGRDYLFLRHQEGDGDFANFEKIKSVIYR
jgi:hypothetical protein